MSDVSAANDYLGSDSPTAGAHATVADEAVAGSRNHVMVAALVAALITILLFLPSCSYPFVNLDDVMNVAGNRYINPTVTLEGVLRFWRGAYDGLYSPVTFSIWSGCALMARLPHAVLLPWQSASSLNPSVFHTIGVLVHVANVFLVFGILRLLLPRLGIGDKRGRAAALGAAVFGIHPVQVEAVAWITGHNNVYSGVFALAAMYVYLIGATGNGDDSVRKSAGRVRICNVAATLLYGLALLAKPTATAAPLMLLALEVLALRRPWRKWAGCIGAWLFIALLFGLATSRGAEHAHDIVTPLYQRPFVLGDALAFYLTKLVWPYPLTMEYDHSIGRVVTSWWGYVTWLLPASIAVLLWRAGPPATTYRVGFALLVAGTLPVLGLVPYYFQPISTVADRYLYLAMLGPALVVAALSAKDMDQPVGPARLVALIGLMTLAFLSAQQIRVWRDPFTSLNHILALSDSSYLAHNEMGTLLAGKQDWPGAEKQFRAALICNPGFELGHAALASVLDAEARHPEAEVEWSNYVRASPNDPDAQFQAARICFSNGRFRDALTATRRTLDLRPDYPGARELLAKIQAKKPAPMTLPGQ